jgi:hypothetical protein
VLGAVLTAAALSVKEHIQLKFEPVAISAAIPIIGVALVIWIAFYVMDHLWYHRLLQGPWIRVVLLKKR